jgi:hypothetical protein
MAYRISVRIAGRFGPLHASTAREALERVIDLERRGAEFVRVTKDEQVIDVDDLQRLAAEETSG